MPTRRRATAASAVALVLAVMAVATGCANKDATAERQAARINDAAFEAAAADACKAAVNTFNTDTTLSKEPTRAQSADTLESIDATFAEMVAKIRRLPAAPADQSAIANWLNDWDAYVAFGHTYAEAVRSGSEQPLIKTQSGIQGDLRRRLRAFAKVNHMAVCRFP